MMRRIALFLIACVVVNASAFAEEKNLSTKSKVILEHSKQLPDYDRIRIYALEGEPDEGVEGFPIPPYGDVACKIVAEKEVTGKQALEICAAWRKLSDETDRGKCHIPPYGFRFYQGDKMMFQTSVCWSCHNYYGPNDKGETIFYDMASDKASEALLLLCRKLLPHPPTNK